MLPLEKAKEVGAMGLETNGHIEILLQERKNRFLAVEEIIDTVCHELAHINTVDHNREWKSTYKKYLKWAKAHLT